MSSEGSELETCCILTTEPNDLIKPLHNRMPVIIPNGSEDEWLTSVNGLTELKDLEIFLRGWGSEEWIAEPLNSSNTYQINLF